jgi:hypothetical protein
VPPTNPPWVHDLKRQGTFVLRRRPRLAPGPRPGPGGRGPGPVSRPGSERVKLTARARRLLRRGPRRVPHRWARGGVDGRPKKRTDLQDHEECVGVSDRRAHGGTRLSRLAPPQRLLTLPQQPRVRCVRCGDRPSAIGFAAAHSCGVEWPALRRVLPMAHTEVRLETRVGRGWAPANPVRGS